MEQAINKEHLTETPKKKKKKHIILIVAIVLILILLALPIILIYGFVYDGYQSNKKYDDNASISEMVNRALFNSIEKTANTGCVDFYLEEDDINSYLHTAFSGTTSESEIDLSYLNNYYIETKNGKSRVYFELDFSWFKTRLSATIEIEYIKDSEPYLQFGISEIKIGKLGNFYNFFVKQLSPYISFNDIAESFKNAGFNITYQQENNRFIYKINHLKDDIAFLLSQSDDELVNSFLFAFFIQSTTLFVQKDNVFLGLTSDLSPYHVDTSSIGVCDVPSYVAKLETLLVNELINESEVEDIYYFLLNGYEKCSKRVQELVRVKNLTTIGINDVLNYSGTKNEFLSNSYDLIYDSITSSTTLDGVLSFESLTSYLRSSDLYGNAYFIIENNAINHLSINDCSIYYGDKNEITLHCGLSVNGYQISANLNFIHANRNNQTIFTFDDATLGNVSLEDGMIDLLFQLLNNNLKDNNEYIVCNQSSRTLTIDFQKFLEDSQLGGTVQTLTSELSESGIKININ